jgi:hypothetical protein
MKYKKISVDLDIMQQEALSRIMDKNKCSISDAVNVAIMLLDNEEQPVFPKNDSLLTAIKDAVKQSQWKTLNQWCKERNIIKPRLFYVINSVSKGKTIIGNGNVKNKFRDAQDDRIFKTHTSYIVHCLKKDLNFDLL